MKLLPRHSTRALVGYIAALLLCSVTPSFSQMWNSTPGSGDWNTPGNWTPNTVPNSAAASATFGTSSVISVSLSANVSVGQIVFNPGASAYTITTAPGATLTISGTGILNNSGSTQNFATQINSSGTGFIVFTNGASAGSSTAFTNAGGVSNGSFGGAEYFDNSSSAGSAIFTNNPGTVNGANGGFVLFDNTSTAGNAVITNLGASVSGGNGGTASFNANSSAGNATIINNAATVTGGFGGYTIFGNSSTAGNATIINNGATLAGSGQEGGYTWFQNTSSAGSATLIANGGSNGGQGGEIAFYNQATGGTAKVILNGNGFLDISGLTAPTTSVTIGSLASGASGGGAVFLGAYNLTVGSNNTSTTFSGVIQDGGTSGGTGGSFTKIGTGLLDLTGASTYTGNTIVAGGSLFVDGSIASPTTTVNLGALLGGHGVIGGSVVNNGVVSPGNSPGTLTINKNYTQGSTGALVIQVAGLGAAQHDLLAVGGKANLAGALQVQSSNGFKFNGAGQSVTFLTAGSGITGTFSSVQNLSSLSGVLTNSKLIYLPNALEIEATQGSVVSALDGASGVTMNDIQTAKLLDSASSNPRASKLFAILDQATTVSQLANDVKLIDPDRLAALSNIGSAISNTTLLSLEQRMQVIESPSQTPGASGSYGPSGPDGKGGKEIMPPPANRWGSFVTGSGDFERIGDTSAARGFNFDSGGVTLGVDYRFSDHFVAGVFAGYTNTGVNIGNGGRIDVNDAKGGIYATYFDGGFYVNSALGGGYTNYDTHRNAFGGTARSSTEGGDFSALFAPGYNFTKGAFTFGPTSRFQYSYEGVDGFNESGSLAPMSINSQHTESIVSGFGAKASYDCKIGSATVRPEVLLEWEHEYGDTTTGIDARLANGSSSGFGLSSPAIGRDDLHLGAGCAVIFSDRCTAYVYYDGQFFRTNYDSSSVTGGFRVSF